MTGNLFVGTGLKFILNNYPDLGFSENVIQELLRSLQMIAQCAKDGQTAGTIESADDENPFANKGKSLQEESR